MSALHTVTAICLTADRLQMTAGAVQCFMAQSYPAELRRLIIWDTGKVKYAPPFVYDHIGIEIWHRSAGPSIGMLRNAAIAEAKSDVIVHWDSDDWSSVDRIAEQVALLQSSGAEIVGYNKVVFWNCRPCDRPGCQDPNPHGADGTGAYIYVNPNVKYAIGASLCYRREFWQRKPFRDLPKKSGGTAEDNVFITGSNCVGVSGIVGKEPRLICRIHGANTSNYSSLIAPSARSHNWARTPEWDDYCARVMAMKVRV